MARLSLSTSTREWPSAALRRRGRFRHPPDGRDWNGIAGEALAWVVPLTALTQATMFSGTIVPGFGPDTSAGLLPMPNVLGYYAVFFAFGALAFFVPDAAKRLGDGWWFLIPSAIVVYPMAIAFSTMAPWGNEIA